MQDFENQLFICPGDGKSLQKKQDCYFCPECESSYVVDNGIIRFLERNDEFYEGAYEAHIKFIPRSESFIHCWPLWLINSGYMWKIRQHVKSGTLLELGCGGGVAYFGKRYQAIGCDLSFSSLKKLVNNYSFCVQADSTKTLPFADSSIDAVASSYFWEHFTLEEKKVIASELFRVLRPGGKIIFLFDVETSNPLISFFKKRDPVKYQKLFCDNDGHTGYHSPAVNRNIFAEAGFTIVESNAFEKTFLLSHSATFKLAEFGWFGKTLFRPLRFIGRHPWFYLHSLLLRVVDSTVGRLLPCNWSRTYMLVCEK